MRSEIKIVLIINFRLIFSFILFIFANDFPAIIIIKKENANENLELKATGKANMCQIAFKKLIENDK